MGFKTINPDYLNKYNDLRTEFIVSTCVTLSKNYRCLNLINKYHNDNKQSIANVLISKPSPYSSYKKVLNPELWVAYERVSNIFHYLETKRNNGEENFDFLRLASKVTPELESFVKSDFKSNPSAVFDTQLNRLKKSIDKFAKDGRKPKPLTEETEKTVVVLTLLKEYIKGFKTRERHFELFEVIEYQVYSYPKFYNITSSLSDATTETRKNIAEKMFDKLIPIYKLFNLNHLRTEFLFSEIEIGHALMHIGSFRDVMKFVAENGLWDVIDVKMPDIDLLRKYSKEIYPEESINKVDNFNAALTQVGCTQYGIFNTPITETDDLTITRDELSHIFFHTYAKSQENQLSITQFVNDIYINARISVLLKSLQSELYKVTTVEVIEVEKQDLSHIEKIEELQGKLNEHTSKSEILSALENENESLKLDIKRYKEELGNKHEDNKELHALRSLLYETSSGVLAPEFEESNIQDLDSMVRDLKGLEIFFIGGAEKWVQKIKQHVPNIIHYDADSQNRNLDTKFKNSNTESIVVYNTALNSHGMSYHLMPSLKSNPNIKLILLNSHPGIKQTIKFVHSQIFTK